MRFRHSARVIALGLLGLLGLDLLAWVQRLAPLTVAVAGLVLVAALVRRRRRLPPLTRPRHIGEAYAPPEAGLPQWNAAAPHRALLAENDRLRAEVGQLRTDLAAARESAMAAWDVAAGRPPRPAQPADPDRDRLLAAPRSGVRPLSGTWEDR
jgi:hypothetical protein